MKIVIDSRFASIKDDDKSQVFEVFPSLFGDSRGFFCEVAKDMSGWPANGMPLWFSNMQWIRQVNRSSSIPGTMRGCHAQTGKNCQGKLVCALTEKIYDVITDGRPDSDTFGKTIAYVLDPKKQNMLFVPRGFLHAFVVPVFAKGPALFEYWCDNVYSKGSETGVNPMSVLPKLAAELQKTANEEFEDFWLTFDPRYIPTLSEKDLAAENIDAWLFRISKEYSDAGKVWYK